MFRVSAAIRFSWLRHISHSDQAQGGLSYIIRHSLFVYVWSLPPFVKMSTAGGETEYPPFDFRIRLGIVFITESASLSALAVASLLAYIAVCNVPNTPTHPPHLISLSLVFCHHHSPGCITVMDHVHSHTSILRQSVGVGLDPSNR